MAPPREHGEQPAEGGRRVRWKSRGDDRRNAGLQSHERRRRAERDEQPAAKAPCGRDRGRSHVQIAPPPIRRRSRAPCRQAAVSMIVARLR